MAWLAISRFTKNNNQNIFKKDVKFIYRYDDNKYLGEVKTIEKKKEYEYVGNGISVIFGKISDRIKNHELIKELTSDKRSGHCHSRSIDFARSIKDSKIVTGYIILGKKKVLHSVIEYESNGETYILDWTKNLRITKEQYVNLTSFIEISSIPSKEVMNDIILLGSLNLGLKPYLTVRNELINAANKNAFMFEIEEKVKIITKSK